MMVVEKKSVEEPELLLVVKLRGSLLLKIGTGSGAEYTGGSPVAEGGEELLELVEMIGIREVGETTSLLDSGITVEVSEAVDS